MLSFGQMITQFSGPIRYFVMVYFARFALGMISEFRVTPAVGLSAALLMEMPVMAIVSFFSARFVLDRAADTKTPSDFLFIGCTAFVLLLIAEETMARILSDSSVFTLWAGLSPFAALTNATDLGLFMLMPLIVGLRRNPATPS